MKTIASRLKELREREGLSSRAFAERVKVAGYEITNPTVLNYEAEEGTEKIPAAYIAAVCKGFNVRPNWLLLGYGLAKEYRPSLEEDEGSRVVAQQEMVLTAAYVVSRVLQSMFEIQREFGVDLVSQDVLRTGPFPTIMQNLEKFTARREMRAAAEDAAVARLRRELGLEVNEPLPGDWRERIARQFEAENPTLPDLTKPASTADPSSTTDVDAAGAALAQKEGAAAAKTAESEKGRRTRKRPA